MTSTSAKPIAADELLKMGDIGRCEFVYGELAMILSGRPSLGYNTRS